MSQGQLIIFCSLAVGVFGALATWIFIDVAGWAGAYLARRKVRKGLEAEAKALKEAESKATEGEEE